MAAGLAYSLGIRPALQEIAEKRGKNAAVSQQSGTSPSCKPLLSVSAAENQLPEWNSNWRQRG